MSLVFTRQLRLGEYCILACGPRNGTVFVNDGIHLAGPADTVIALARRCFAWRDLRDKQAAYLEARSALLDSASSKASRAAAFFSMAEAAQTGGWLDDGRAPLYAQLQHTLVEILQDPTAPAELKDRAVNALKVDSGRPLARGSDDEAKIRYLLQALSDRNPQRAQQAGERLYYICVYAGTLTKPGTGYYYPDTIQTLELRESQDRAMDPQHRGAAASHTTAHLSNARRLIARRAGTLQGPASRSVPAQRHCR